MTDRRSMRGRGAGGPFAHRCRCAETRMKLGGCWQCIAPQDCLLPAKEGAR